MFKCHPINEPRFGTRLFNAGLPTDPASIMLTGIDKGLAFGLGQTAEEGDLVILRSPPFAPEPFFVEEAHAIPGFKGFASMWIGKVVSLLKLKDAT